MEAFWLDYTVRTVALGAASLGLVSGALGTFAVLRRQSLLGDAISHAALPGIALAFLLTGTRSMAGLLAGAAAAGWLATMLVRAADRTTRVKYDTALALFLSVFFGVGLLLLTFIQKRPDATQAGLETFLFGQAAALVERDVMVMGGLGAVVLAALAAFWKEFKLLSFDAGFGQSLGLPMRGLDVGLTTLLVAAIVLGLQTVGVVLMSAMLIAPAAAARQWTDRLAVMVGLAALFGAAAGVGGALLSSTTARLPTGPTIVLFATVLVAVSLLAAPHRGLLWRVVRRRRSGRRLSRDAVLLDLFALAAQHDDPDHPHPASVLAVMGTSGARVRPALEALARRGDVREHDAGTWVLTDQGRRRAETLLHERTTSAERGGAS